MWLFILCVNLTELKGAQRAGKSLFLGVSVRMSLETIESKDQPPPIWVATIQSTKGLNRIKRWRKDSCLLEWRSLFSPAFGHSAWILDFQTQTGTYPISPPGSQPTGFGLNYNPGFPACGTFWFPEPHEPIPVINLYIYIHIYTYTCYWFCFSRESHWLTRFG